MNTKIFLGLSLFLIPFATFAQQTEVKKDSIERIKDGLRIKWFGSLSHQ